MNPPEIGMRSLPPAAGQMIPAADGTALLTAAEILPDLKNLSEYCEILPARREIFPARRKNLPVVCREILRDRSGNSLLPEKGTRRLCPEIPGARVRGILRTACCLEILPGRAVPARETGLAPAG